MHCLTPWWAITRWDSRGGAVPEHEVTEMVLKKIATGFLIVWGLVLAVSLRGMAAEYKIKPGDVLEIIVYGHEELSRMVTVKENGTVDFPFLQDIPVDGLSIVELREIIVIQLSKYIAQKPLVSVVLPETYPIEVTVLGQIARPGSHQIRVNSTVQGAIGEAGGFLPGADLTAIRIVRKKTGNGGKEEFRVNVKDFLVRADVDKLPRLQNGDVIIVPSFSGSSTVKVLGEVNRPGSYELTLGNDTLLDVLFMAGGVTKKANTHSIKIISPWKQSKQEIHINLNKNMTSDQFDALPEIKPGDIVYVSKKPFEWRTFMNFLRDLTTLATLYVLIDRVKNSQ